jgi:hypothetical protein
LPVPFGIGKFAQGAQTFNYSSTKNTKEKTFNRKERKKHKEFCRRIFEATPVLARLNAQRAMSSMSYVRNLRVLRVLHGIRGENIKSIGDVLGETNQDE